MHSDPSQRPSAKEVVSWSPSPSSHSASVDGHSGGSFGPITSNHPARGLLQLSAGNKMPDGTAGVKGRHGSAGCKENRRKGTEQKPVRKGTSAASMLPLTKLFG